MFVYDRNYLVFLMKEKRCALNKEILDLFHKKAFLQHAVVKLVYNEKCIAEKSTAKVPFKLFWGQMQ